MTAIQKLQPEVVSPDERTKAQQVEDYVARLVDERVAELMARKGISQFQPFFETKAVSDELRRLQHDCDWHKFRVSYERWGCIDCKTRTEPHGALGMCKTCYHRWEIRLNVIREELGKASEGAGQIIDNEIQAYMAYRKAAPSLVPEQKLLPSPTDPPIDSPIKKKRRPHLKPQMLPEEAGPRMRRLRELAGLSLRRLAKMAEVSPLTVLKFEQGKRQPLPANCAAIKRALVESLVEAFWPTPEGYQ